MRIAYYTHRGYEIDSLLFYTLLLYESFLTFTHPYITHLFRFQTATLLKLLPNTDVHIFLTSRLRSDLVQPICYRLLIDVTLFQYFCLKQRKVAFLEVDDNRAGDVLAFFGTHSHHGCQMPLQIITSQLPSNKTVVHKHTIIRR